MQFSNNDLARAHELSSNHKPELERNQKCGCFYCGKRFFFSEIKDWIIADTPIDRRGTALCPYCEVDSVIRESSGFLITEEFLSAMKDYWF